MTNREQYLHMDVGAYGTLALTNLYNFINISNVKQADICNNNITDKTVDFSVKFRVEGVANENKEVGDVHYRILTAVLLDTLHQHIPEPNIRLSVKNEKGHSGIFEAVAYRIIDTYKTIYQLQSILNWDLKEVVIEFDFNLSLTMRSYPGHVELDYSIRLDSMVHHKDTIIKQPNSNYTHTFSG